MVQVRDNGKVCRLAVSRGVFAPPNRCVGKSQQFSHRVQTPGGAPRRAATFRAIMAARRPKILPVLTLDNGQSRRITVNGVERHSQSRCGNARRVAMAMASNHPSFSQIAHQPFAGADQAHQGKSRLIPVNPASQFFRLPKISPPLPPPIIAREIRFRVRRIAQSRSGFQPLCLPGSASRSLPAYPTIPDRPHPIALDRSHWSGTTDPIPALRACPQGGCGGSQQSTWITLDNGR